MYFKDFPEFLYDFKYGNTADTKMSVVTDITRNIRFRKEVLENYSLYDEYDIKDGETPEIIAEKVYGNAQYHWIIMLTNQRYDYISDFPLDYTALMAETAAKYNPPLYSEQGNWYFEGTGADRKLYYTITKPKTHFENQQLVTAVTITISGQTTTAPFSFTFTYSPSIQGFDYLTQQFWVKTTAGLTGTPTGTLTITTSGRENEPLYWVDERGFRVTSDTVGALPVTGVQEEERLNESKRRIKLISPGVIGQILKQYKDLM